MEGGSGANIVLASSPQLVDGEVGLRKARAGEESQQKHWATERRCVPITRPEARLAWFVLHAH